MLILCSVLIVIICHIFYTFVAVRQRSYEMVSSLIMGGAFVEQTCLTKWTATHEAAKVNSAA